MDNKTLDPTTTTTTATTTISSGATPAVDLDEADAAPGSPELPLTMTASTVLSHLPEDVNEALDQAGRFAQDKVVLRFKPVGSIPLVRRDVCKVGSTLRFEAVVAFLRKSLKARDSDSVFLYVNSSFAPSLDEVVGNLHQCFKDSNDQLIISYALTPAFG